MTRIPSVVRLTSRLHRSLALGLTALMLFVTLVGCGDSYRPRATGPNEQITVVMDSTHWQGPLGEAVRQNVAPYVNTLPTPERMFDLKQVDLTSSLIFDNVQKRKNVIFVAPLSDSASSNVASFLRDRLSADALNAVESGQTAVVPKPDLWRASQRIYFITASTSDGIIKALEANGPDIQDTFREIILTRQQREMFDRGRQPALEDTLMAHHDFAVNVQHDYQIAIDTTNFVWLRRILLDSRRSLFVYYKENADPSTITPEWIYATRDSLTKRYMQGNVGGYVKVDYRRPLDTENINFLDRYAFETRGLWYMIEEEEDGSITQFGGGGPFVNYTFYDQPSGRIYMVDGMVFAPKYDKRDFLRQLEVIARTFRTQQEAQQTESGPVASRSE